MNSRTARRIRRRLRSCLRVIEGESQPDSNSRLAVSGRIRLHVVQGALAFTSAPPAPTPARRPRGVTRGNGDKR